MTTRHHFDTASFVFGLLTLAAGFALFAGPNDLDLDLSWVLPTALLATGAVLLVRILRRRRAEPSPVATTSEV